MIDFKELARRKREQRAEQLDPSKVYDETGTFIEKTYQNVKSRPICPICGKPAIITDERFGGKYECPEHELWSWGGKPLKSREEHRKAKAEYKKRPKTVTTHMTLDDLAYDPDAWWRVLEVTETADATAIKAAFRKLALRAHPDHGGTAEQMDRLKRARDQGVEACTPS